MTPRQARFIAEYLKDGNGQQAAVRAGYKPDNARIVAHKILRKPDVQAQLAAARAPVLDDAKVTLEGHLQKLADIRDEAMKAKQFAAARAAECDRGKVSGFYIERSIVQTQELPALTVE